MFELIPVRLTETEPDANCVNARRDGLEAGVMGESAVTNPVAIGLLPDLRSMRRVRVPVSGDVDMANADAHLSALMRSLEDPSVSELVVDLGRLRFMDCSGVRILLEARDAARRRGVRFRVIDVNGLPRRVLEILRLEAILTDP